MLIFVPISDEKSFFVEKLQIFHQISEFKMMFWIG